MARNGAAVGRDACDLERGTAAVNFKTPAPVANKPFPHQYVVNTMRAGAVPPPAGMISNGPGWNTHNVPAAMMIPPPPPMRVAPTYVVRTPSGNNILPHVAPAHDEGSIPIQTDSFGVGAQPYQPPRDAPPAPPQSPAIVDVMTMKHTPPRPPQAFVHSPSKVQPPTEPAQAYIMPNSTTTPMQQQHQPNPLSLQRSTGDISVAVTLPPPAFAPPQIQSQYHPTVHSPSGSTYNSVTQQQPVSPSKRSQLLRHSKLRPPGPGIPNIPNSVPGQTTLHTEPAQTYQLGVDDGEGLRSAKRNAIRETLNTTTEAAGNVWGMATFIGSKILSGVDFVGEKLADVIGITQPKYGLYMEDALEYQRSLEEEGSDGLSQENARILQQERRAGTHITITSHDVVNGVPSIRTVKMPLNPMQPTATSRDSRPMNDVDLV
ncbi:hypothetical protein HK102_013901 [Quaeritorhiza haematococci]|nr:hypothetical protein HK102_013901 [Quaeritorhiza haematococci]